MIYFTCKKEKENSSNQKGKFMLDFFQDHPVVSVILAVILIIAFAFIPKSVKNIFFNGNEQIIDTVWRYNWCIVQLGNGELLEGQITSWKDFNESDMIQFTIDGITYLTHSSNVILCTKCP